MVNYYTCPRCSYSTDRKSSIKVHLEKKNLCELVLFDVKPSNYMEKILAGENIVLELELKEKIKKLEEENEILRKMTGNNNTINTNSNNRTTNHNITNNINNNFTIVLPYDKSDISHISEKEMTRMLNRGLMSVNPSG